MKNLLTLTVFFCAAAFGNLQAQSINDELDMHAFARKFMAAYNDGDHVALRKLYVDDAVRIDQAGKEIKGADNIVAYFADQFRLNNATLLLKQSGLHWSDFEHGWVAKGNYEVYGITNVYDIKIHLTGTYNNTMAKENGQWKIAKTVLNPLIKTVVYHQVKDFAQWKSSFEQGLPNIKAAGGMIAEIGTLHGDPNTTYVISEWPSVEAFQSFFSNPKLKESMGEAGVVGKPTVLILDQQ